MKPPLTWLKMTPFDLLVLLERLLELDPALLAPRLVARDHGFAERVLDPLEIDFDLVAEARRRIAAVIGEFLERHAPFGLEADVDDRHVLFDRDDLALDDRSFERFVGAVGLVQQSGEILARGRQGLSGSHWFS